MNLNITKTKRQTVFSLLVTSFFLVISLTLLSEDKQNGPDLLEQYIISKSYQSTIIFDYSNIKQFWIDNSVSSKDNNINIILSSNSTNSNESVPLKIQLANVNETLDCKIEVISETEDLGFSVLNNSSKVLSSSKKTDNFLNYSVTSTFFHLEDTPKKTFALKFNSKSSESLSIKKIILSFSDNKESLFLFSPGKINYTNKNINTSSKVEEGNSNSFSVTGKRTIVFSSKRIIPADNALVSSLTIKNTGNMPTTLYIGYGAYTQDGVWLNGKNYPFKVSCGVLNVVSTKDGSNIITVDTFSDWGKGCLLALDAKEDLSDIPNNNFAEGKVSEIRKSEKGQVEIILDKPLTSKIKEGTKIRIHGVGGTYIYTASKTLQPGEEQTFTSTIQKDDKSLEYSPRAFSKGTYYVVPIILSYSIDSSKENTISVSDFSISY